MSKYYEICMSCCHFCSRPWRSIMDQAISEFSDILTPLGFFKMGASRERMDAFHDRRNELMKQQEKICVSIKLDDGPTDICVDCVRKILVEMEACR